MTELTQETDALQVSVGSLTSRAARLFAQALTQAQQALHILPAQYRILLELWREDGLAQKDLIARLDIEQSTIGNTLNRMVKDGLISRQPHPQDGRSQSLSLTPYALKLKDQALRDARYVNEKALSGFSGEEREQFIALMHKMIEALKDES